MSPLRILYAEDDPRDADLTRAALQARGREFALEVVHSGLHFMERARAGTWDLFLVDYRLADLDGLEVLRRLGAAAIDVPVVITTGAGRDELVIRALRAGAADYLTKSGGYLQDLPERLRQVVVDFQRSASLGQSMASRRRRVLYVEPNSMDRDLTFAHFVARAPRLELTVVEEPAGALRVLEDRSFDLLLTDLRTPGMTGLDLLREARHRALRIPIVVVTGHGDEDAALASLRLGAFDYVVKREGYLAHLPSTIENAIVRFQIQLQAEAQQAELAELKAKMEEKVAARTAALDREVQVRRDAQEARQHSDERHRSLLEGMSDGYALVSMDGRIVEANDAFTQMVGWTLEELRARSFADLTPERWRSEERRILDEEVMTSGSSDVYEKEYLRKDGTVVPVELRTFLVRDRRGEPTGMWAIVRDVTERSRARLERERLQAELVQAQKLESVGRLAGGVAHDFNNLLTAIMGCSEALRSDLESGKAASLGDVEEILAAAKRARDVTRQLLAFARKQVIAPVVLDVGAVVRSTERLLKRLLGEDVRLEMVLQEDLWPVLCDPTQLEQVVLNLALNARDAMPHGGMLTIEARNRPRPEPRPSEDPRSSEGDLVVLSVRDTGEGMSEEVLAHLFEPFFTTKAQGHGTGLGLATVHGIVSQSGGRLEVQSRPGAGTVFQVFLPRATEPVANPEAAPPSSGVGPDVGATTILYAEDEEAVRGVTARILRKAGYRVLVAQGGAEALALSDHERGELSLLVTDVVMPGLDGRALADELRRRRGPLRVLYLSGYTQEVISHAGVLDPSIRFLAKPYSAEALLAEVRGALAGTARATSIGEESRWAAQTPGG